MDKLLVVVVLVVLSFFINLLYYVCWVLMDHWLEPAKMGEPVKTLSVSSQQ